MVEADSPQTVLNHFEEGRRLYTEYQSADDHEEATRLADKAVAEFHRAKEAATDPDVVRYCEEATEKLYFIAKKHRFHPSKESPKARPAHFAFMRDIHNYANEEADRHEVVSLAVLEAEMD